MARRPMTKFWNPTSFLFTCSTITLSNSINLSPKILISWFNWRIFAWGWSPEPMLLSRRMMPAKSTWPANEILYSLGMIGCWRIFDILIFKFSISLVMLLSCCWRFSRSDSVICSRMVANWKMIFSFCSMIAVYSLWDLYWREPSSKRKPRMSATKTAAV